MIVKLLGLFDFISAISFWVFATFGVIPKEFILLVAIYLLVKGLYFIAYGGLVNILDILCSLIIFVSITIQLPLASVFAFIIAIYLIQKSILSLIS